MSIHPDRNAKSPGQTKVCYFNTAILVDQEILWLHVPVENPALMAEQHPLQQLICVGFGKLGIHLSVLGNVGVHVLFQVHGQELEN